MFDKDYKSIISFIEDLNKNGKNINKFIEEFISFIRDIIYYKLSGEFLSVQIDDIDSLSNICSFDIFYKLLRCLNELFNDVKNSSVPYILLSVSLINISNLLIDEFNNIGVNINSNSVNDLNVNEIKSVDNFIKSDVNNVESLDVNNKFSFMSDELKMIRINNTFYSASKEKLNELKKKWNIDELLFDEKFSSIAGLLKDVEIIVVGESNAMFLVNQDSLIDRLYSHINDIEKMIYDKFNYNLKVVFLTSSEWELEKKKYIDNIKSGYKYSYIEEIDNNNDDIIDNNEKKVDDVNKIIDIIGDEVIKYI